MSGARITGSSTYTNPVDPRVTGAAVSVGDVWVDTSSGKGTAIWDGTEWKPVGWAGAEEPTELERQLEEAGRVRSGDEVVRLGDHAARRLDGGDWACDSCGGVSADARVLAETGCP